jgi:hypothetical protein
MEGIGRIPVEFIGKEGVGSRAVLEPEGDFLAFESFY